ncbi:MAG: hypothetical protein HY754_07070 [Nitrospirae bacterium]|nr:hypothetical protein [Nitrospirota bacterium]
MLKKGLFHKPVLHVLLISAVGLLAYSNTFSVPFQFDDCPDIIENPINKRLFLSPTEQTHEGNLRYKVFKSRYIGCLTLAMNYRLHGTDVTGYHIFNLAVHIANAILVHWLVALTLRTLEYQRVKVSKYQSSEDSDPMILSRFDTSFIALFSALIFVSHPIQTQAVTYIVQRLTSLATFFYLLSLVMYIKFRLHDTKKMHDAGYTIHDKENHTSCIMNRESCIVSRASCIMYLASLFSAVLAIYTAGCYHPLRVHVFYPVRKQLFREQMERK